MPAEVRLPQAGMGMTDGTVLEWLKQVGEQVRKGECIAEVEAAKTTLEIEAPCDGVLARIVAPAGTLVPVREVMAVIALPGEGPGEGDVTGAAEAAPETSPAHEAPVTAAVQVVPAARKLARDHGIDLAGVSGSGPGGRITEADVRAHFEARADAVPLTGTRGLIARRMMASLRDSAQFTLIRSADVTDLVHRHDHGDLPGGATYTDVLARAVVLSLSEHPALNAHIVGDEIRIARRVHLGIGIDTGVALLVGVLRDADADGLAELSARRLALTERVRAGHADPAELQGSTFTITNLGHAGIDAFTPIINPPEVAILGAGRITDEPVPAPGGPGGPGEPGGSVSRTCIRWPWRCRWPWRGLAQIHHAQSHRRPPGRRRRARCPVPRNPRRLPQQTHGSVLAGPKVTVAKHGCHRRPLTCALIHLSCLRKGDRGILRAFYYFHGRNYLKTTTPCIATYIALERGSVIRSLGVTMDAEGLRSAVFSRRSALKTGAATAFLLSQAALLEELASPVARADSAPTMFPDIQFDLGAFINPAEVLNDGAGNVTLQFPPALHAVPAGPAIPDAHPERPGHPGPGAAHDRGQFSGQPGRRADLLRVLRPAVFQPPAVGAGRGQYPHHAHGSQPSGARRGRPVRHRRGRRPGWRPGRADPQRHQGPLQRRRCDREQRPAVRVPQ